MSDQATKPIDPAADPASPVQKPGFKTSEFWLALAATLLGALIASGLLDVIPGERDDQIAAMLLSLLASLGYSTQRAFVKASGNKAAAIVAAAKGNADPS